MFCGCIQNYSPISHIENIGYFKYFSQYFSHVWGNPLHYLCFHLSFPSWQLQLTSLSAQQALNYVPPEGGVHPQGGLDISIGPLTGFF